MDIRETVHSAMNENGLSGYRDRANPVISALEDREADCVSALIDFAVDQGLSRDSAEGAMRDAGLMVPSANGTTETDERIDALEQTLRDVQETLASLRSNR